MVLQDGQIVGIVSERDYARKVVSHGKVSMKTPAWEIMTEEVISVSPQVTIKEAMALMTEKHIRHLPVIERTKIVYLISIGDLVKSIIADQEFMINQLEK